MTGRGDRTSDAAGGPARHVPVLLNEVVDALAPRPGGRYLDGTFGAGGYTRAVLDAAPDIRVLAVDRDPDAITGGATLVSQAAGRLMLVEGRFGDLADLARQFDFAPLDGIVLDIGVSSMQLEDPHRGFLLPRRRAARHAHGAVRAKVRLISSINCQKRSLPI